MLMQLSQGVGGKQIWKQQPWNNFLGKIIIKIMIKMTQKNNDVQWKKNILP